MNRGLLFLKKNVFVILVFCLFSPAQCELLAQGVLEPPFPTFHFGVIKQKGEAKVELRFQQVHAPFKLVTRQVEQNYLVQVPYVSKEMKGGREVAVTRMRSESRTRTVDHDFMEPQPLITLQLDQIKAFSLTGARISTSDLSHRLVGTRPVIVVDEVVSSQDYFSQVFSEDALLVVLPEEYSRNGWGDYSGSPIYPYGSPVQPTGRER